MARYAISCQGMEALRHLAGFLNNVCNDIDQSTYQLVSSIADLEGLGIFKQYIGECISIMRNTIEQAKGPAEVLAFKAYDIANQIEQLLPPEAFPSNDDGSSYPPPPQKHLVKK